MVGRPRKNTEGNGMQAQDAQDAPVKKGARPTWKPAGQIGYLNVPSTHKGRWVNASDEINLARKQEEGWEYVNKTNFPEVARFTDEKKRVVGKDHIGDGGQLGGPVRYREMVGMMLSNDLVEARTEYYRKETEHQTRGRIKSKTQNKDANVKYSRLVIE